MERAAVLGTERPAELLGQEEEGGRNKGSSDRVALGPDALQRSPLAFSQLSVCLTPTQARPDLHRGVRPEGFLG